MDGRTIVLACGLEPIKMSQICYKRFHVYFRFEPATGRVTLVVPRYFQCEGGLFEDDAER